MARQTSRNDGGGSGLGGGRRRGRVSVTWLLLAVILTAAISVGACAFLRPDRHPAVLARAGEITSAPVAAQQYDAKRQITVVPTVSAPRKVLINTSGTVTADYSAGGLHSGAAALEVDGRPIVALATASPLYRDLAPGDVGEDVRALNAELTRLGYNANPESDQYSSLTYWAVVALFGNLAVRSDGALPLADVIWLPQDGATASSWQAATGAMVAAASPIAEIPGAITSLTVKNGTPNAADQTITVFGEQGVLKAGATVIDDPEFCARVTASRDFQWAQQGGDLSQGVDATVALATPVDVLRVPAAAVFGVKGDRGCIASDGRTMPVTIIGADLGVSSYSWAMRGPRRAGRRGMPPMGRRPKANPRVVWRCRKTLKRRPTSPSAVQSQVRHVPDSWKSAWKFGDREVGIHGWSDICRGRIRWVHTCWNSSRDC
ncbi:hypothetical protein BREU_1878 [Bifidobacterium reuteri DSM 23975]|uniref:Uncharacterized protein n=1 Tax=Bifidobacterium reuteri DSM 23975 TaxID=1437610 RepID=A0A087CNZ3_9BIFI|nr:peptidoglycan-binding domain-containing protein [Bifidobacterium reuteri]KFI84993.1 hypothetical protein BREU_1878 [Bifidobacterium reuteri DSM 23975]